MIVSPQVEPDLVILQTITNCNLSTLAVDFLISDRPRLSNFKPVSAQDQLPSFVYGISMRAIEVHPDWFWGVARRNYEVILKLLLIPVVDKVDAGVGIGVPDCRVGRNVPAPFARITSD